MDLRAIEESWTDLPLIVNRKPVVPHDEDSEKVIQLESAMGAAIGTVENAGAIEVGRDRFFPVKTTNDLFGVRSDLYRLNEVSVLEATADKTPGIDLDPEHFKMMAEFDALVRGVPSLLRCRRLKVKGPVIFQAGDELIGDVMLENPGKEPLGVSEL